MNTQFPPSSWIMALCLLDFKLHDLSRFITANKIIILEQWFPTKTIFPQGGLELFLVVLLGNTAAVQRVEARESFSLQCTADTHNKEIYGQSADEVGIKQPLQRGRCSRTSPPGPLPLWSQFCHAGRISNSCLFNCFLRRMWSKTIMYCIANRLGYLKCAW